MNYNELLKAAEEEFINAINLAVLVETGSVSMPVRGLLRLYAILKNWYTTYEQKAEDSRQKGDDDMVQSYEGIKDMLSSEIERFEDIFRGLEFEIRCYFRKLQLGQSLPEQILQDAAIFAEMAEKNQSMVFHDWKLLLPDGGK